MRASLVLLAVILASPTLAADWNPAGWAGQNTLELRTTSPGESEHWSPVWLVVLDDQLYIRLGSRAAGRIETNQTAPLVGVRIAGKQFDRVRGVPAPDQTARVAKAMGDKYWSDVLIRHMNHPLTLRLVPE